jgi:hypothetical protein
MFKNKVPRKINELRKEEVAIQDHHDNMLHDLHSSPNNVCLVKLGVNM